MNRDRVLKVIEVLPSKYQNMFEYDYFNNMQSVIFHQAFLTENNMVIAAPTGSGKTVIHELAILNLIQRKEINQMKCVLITPNKALCQQRTIEWKRKFESLGVNVLEVTGDSDLNHSLQLIAKASIIITTPEKWDSLTRSWKDHIFLLGCIDLLLIDEIHHLGDDRGAVLESVVVRMRMLSSTYSEKKYHSQPMMNQNRMRIIGLSATLPNLSDIGDWLRCDPECVHYFDDSFRPVPLTTHTVSFGSAGNPFLFERLLDDRVQDIIRKYGENKQTLIFCSSKLNAETLCMKLSSRLYNALDERALQNVRHTISIIKDQKLHEAVLKRCGYHHSGLPPDDRLVVENLYLSGYIQVLCSTSTLAHGVNLPAHLVIVKGTNCWRGGTRGYERIPKSEMIQMLGRAGRPGFDEKGVAVIMTSDQDKEHYSGMSLKADIVESALQTILIEAICAEITQGVILSVEDCVKWMKSTYFYIRSSRNPTKYGFQTVHSLAEFDDQITQCCLRSLRSLQDSRLILYHESNQTIQSLPEANIMTKCLIKYDTMNTLMQLDAKSSILEILHGISMSKELEKMVRRNEKKVLNDAMKTIRYPLRNIRVQEPWQKSYVLLQSAVSRSPAQPFQYSFHDFSLRVEQSEVVERSLRILHALIDLSKLRGYGVMLESALILDRALRTQMWENPSIYQSVFIQCPNLPDTAKSNLIAAQINGLGSVEGLSIQRLQQLTKLNAMECQQVLQFASLLRFAARFVQVSIVNEKTLSFDIRPLYPVGSTTVPPVMETSLRTLYPIVSYHLLCYDVHSSELLCYRNIKIDVQSMTDHRPQSFLVTCKGSDLSMERIQYSLISSIVGLDYHHTPKIETILLDNTTAATQSSSMGKKMNPGPKRIRSVQTKLNPKAIHPPSHPLSHPPSQPLSKTPWTTSTMINLNNTEFQTNDAMESRNDGAFHVDESNPMMRQSYPNEKMRKIMDSNNYRSTGPPPPLPPPPPPLRSSGGGEMNFFHVVEPDEDIHEPEPDHKMKPWQTISRPAWSGRTDGGHLKVAVDSFATQLPRDDRENGGSRPWMSQRDNLKEDRPSQWQTPVSVTGARGSKSSGVVKPSKSYNPMRDELSLLRSKANEMGFQPMMTSNRKRTQSVAGISAFLDFDDEKTVAGDVKTNRLNPSRKTGRSSVDLIDCRSKGATHDKIFDTFFDSPPHPAAAPPLHRTGTKPLSSYHRLDPKLPPTPLNRETIPINTPTLSTGSRALLSTPMDDSMSTNRMGIRTTENNLFKQFQLSPQQLPNTVTHHYTTSHGLPTAPIQDSFIDTQDDDLFTNSFF